MTTDPDPVLQAGHAGVRAALTAKLSDGLTGYGYLTFPDIPDDDTPDGAVWVAGADAMPADEARWPFVIVHTTRMTGSKRTGHPGQLMCTYRCEISCGVRTSEPDPDGSRIAAADARDALLLAVRNVLTRSQALPGGRRVITSGADAWTEQTYPTVWEKTGRAVAFGTVQFTVTSLDTADPPDSDDPPVVVTTARTEIHPHPYDTPTL